MKYCRPRIYASTSYPVAPSGSSCFAIDPTALSNEPRPFANSHTPPPPGMEKLNCRLQLPLFIAACIEGMKGASAMPSKVFTALLFFFPKRNSGLVEVMVRVWCAYCQLKARWNPSGMKTTPAGLLYTPSRPIAASREGFLRNATLWLVFVRIPPAKVLLAMASNSVVTLNLILVILSNLCKNWLQSYRYCSVFPTKNTCA